MPNNKVIAVLTGLLTVAVIILGYLFFETYTEIKSEKMAGEVVGKSNVPAEAESDLAGAEMPLQESGGETLPISTNPDGFQVPLKVDKPAMKEEKNQVQNNAFQESSQWRIYTNKKYSYSFKFPSNFDNRECTSENPCKFGQMFEKDGGDLAYVSAQTNMRGWPYVTVAHYNNENFTLAKDQKLVDWFKSKFQGESTPKDYNYEIKVAKGDPKKAIRVSFPQTPQAYAKEEIYFALGNNIFQIQLLDTNKSEAWGFYNPWLESFVLQ